MVEQTTLKYPTKHFTRSMIILPQDLSKQNTLLETSTLDP
jgi:hypothetical protein